MAQYVTCSNQSTFFHGGSWNACDLHECIEWSWKTFYHHPNAMWIFTVRNEVAKATFVHLSVILFTGGRRGVCLSACWDTTPQDQAPRSRRPPPGADHPRKTAAAADGTHPTGMHSCYNIWLDGGEKPSVTIQTPRWTVTKDLSPSSNPFGWSWKTFYHHPNTETYWNWCGSQAFLYSLFKVIGNWYRNFSRL